MQAKIMRKFVDVSRTKDTYQAERTICILNGKPNETLSFSVVLSTQSSTVTPFSLLVTIEKDFMLE